MLERCRCKSQMMAMMMMVEGTPSPRPQTRNYKPQTPNPKPQASTEACGNCVSSLDTRSEQLKRAASQAGNGQDDVDQVQKK